MVDMDGRSRNHRALVETTNPLKVHYYVGEDAYNVYVTDNEVMILVPTAAIEYPETESGYKENLVTLPVGLVKSIAVNMIREAAKQNLDNMSDDEYLNFVAFAANGV